MIPGPANLKEGKERKQESESNHNYSQDLVCALSRHGSQSLRESEEKVVVNAVLMVGDGPEFFLDG